jgi:hypothetical protein
VIAQNSHALQHTSTKLRADKDVVLAAVNKNKSPIDYCFYREDLSPVFFDINDDNANLMTPVAQSNIRRTQYTQSVLSFALGNLEADRDIVLAAVKQNDYAMFYGATVLRADKEIILASVKKKPSTLQFASPELRADREIVLAAIEKDFQTLRLASEDLKKALGNNKKIVFTAGLKQLGPLFMAAITIQFWGAFLFDPSTKLETAGTAIMFALSLSVHLVNIGLTASYLKHAGALPDLRASVSGFFSHTAETINNIVQNHQEEVTLTLAPM